MSPRSRNWWVQAAPEMLAWVPTAAWVPLGLQSLDPAPTLAAQPVAGHARACGSSCSQRIVALLLCVPGAACMRQAALQAPSRVIKLRRTMPCTRRQPPPDALHQSTCIHCSSQLHSASAPGIPQLSAQPYLRSLPRLLQTQMDEEVRETEWTRLKNCTAKYRVINGNAPRAQPSVRTVARASGHTDLTIFDSMTATEGYDWATKNCLPNGARVRACWLPAAPCLLPCHHADVHADVQHFMPRPAFKTCACPPLHCT
jgi:hypothetical protein